MDGTTVKELPGAMSDGKSFHFDACFPEQSTQQDVYQAIEPIVTGVMHGFNGTIMSKIHVNGEKEHPVFSFLKNQPGCHGNIMWNFRTKFIVARDGTVSRFDGIDVKKLEPEITKRLDLPAVN